jgi:hypothetical protein
MRDGKEVIHEVGTIPCTVGYSTYTQVDNVVALAHLCQIRTTIGQVC